MNHDFFYNKGCHGCLCARSIITVLRRVIMIPHAPGTNCLRQLAAKKKVRKTPDSLVNIYFFGVPIPSKSNRQRLYTCRVLGYSNYDSN